MTISNLTRSAAAAAVMGTSALIPVPAAADPLPYGPDTCIQGYVWREARPGDTVCVTPEIRATVAKQNSTPGANKDPNAGSGPQSCSQGYVWREAFDGDTIDPSGPNVSDHTKIPWQRTITVGPDVQLLQVVATGRQTPGPGCRITVDGKVVAEQPIGGSAHCVFSRF